MTENEYRDMKAKLAAIRKRLDDIDRKNEKA